MKRSLTQGFRGFWNLTRQRILLAALCLGFSALAMPAAHAQLSGAIFTTDSTCTVVNENTGYLFKSEVYLDGGPAHLGAAGLPDGEYYCQVTTPNGGVLGKTLDPVVIVAGGEFVECYQLIDILYKASSLFTIKGFDDTTNPGGVYKAWISTSPDFLNSESKTDNFKVEEDEEDPGPPLGQAELCAIKFYDANVNGTFDSGETEIIDWLVQVNGTPTGGSPIPELQLSTPSCTFLLPGLYSLQELSPIEDDWIHTTPTLISNIALNAGDHLVYEFGNVCIGAGGGKTLGFWSNKNGQKLFIVGTDLAMLQGLNLRNANGTDFNPATYGAFRTWLLGGNAVNMSYMLSVQLSAMELNVFNGLVTGSSLVYAPQLLPYAPITGLNPLGFISVSDLMTAANTELGIHGDAFAGKSYRAYQEAIKDALDDGNNNLNFVQPEPCPFSFFTL